MSAVLENYCCVVVRNAGASGESFGFLRSPVGEATIGGDHIAKPERLSIPPADYITLWEQSHNKLKFQQLGFRIVGDGSLNVFWRTDLPTSSSDYTPLGTRQRWHNKDQVCNLQPWWLNSQTALSVSTLANEVADDGGLPRLMTTDIETADTVIVDKVVVYNPGDAAVIIERFLAN